MKRDMDVVRRIVLALQDADSTLNGVEGVEQAMFLEHARLLVDEGLAEGHILVTGVPPKAQCQSLSPYMGWSGFRGCEQRRNRLGKGEKACAQAWGFMDLCIAS